MPRELQSQDSSALSGSAQGPGGGTGGGHIDDLSSFQAAARPLPEIRLPSDLPDLAQLGSSSIFSGCAATSLCTPCNSVPQAISEPEDIYRRFKSC